MVFDHHDLHANLLSVSVPGPAPRFDTEPPSRPHLAPNGPQNGSKIAPEWSLGRKRGTSDLAVIYFTWSTLGSPTGYPNWIKKDLQKSIAAWP